MFGLHLRAPQSYHWRESEGRMVPCDSTPCSRHRSDVTCGSLKEAEEAHARAVARMEAKARADNARAQEVEAANDSMSVVLTPEQDARSRNESMTSVRYMFIGNQKYALSTNGLCAVCPQCHGTGRRSYLQNDGGYREYDCDLCGGFKYSTANSGTPAEMVLAQQERYPDDGRFHDFVRTHPEEFNSFILHSMHSKTYLGNEAEKEIYAPWANKNPKEMMANRPQEALTLMKSLASRYGHENAQWEQMSREDNKRLDDAYYHIMNIAVPQRSKAETEELHRTEAQQQMNLVRAMLSHQVYRRWNVYDRIEDAGGVVIKSNRYKDRRTGVDMCAFCMYDGDRDAITQMFSGRHFPEVGDEKVIPMADVTSVKQDSDGRIIHVVKPFDGTDLEVAHEPMRWRPLFDRYRDKFCPMK